MSRYSSPDSKKGQGISITTIVIAVLALIVLVVLVMIFTGQIGKFGKGVEAQKAGCVDLGGQWLPEGSPCAEQIFIITNPDDRAAHRSDLCCKTPTVKK